MRPVHDLFRMAEAEVHLVAGVAGVRADCREAFGERGPHVRGTDGAAEAAVPGAQQPAVPRGTLGNPQLDLDVRV